MLFSYFLLLQTMDPLAYHFSTDYYLEFYFLQEANGFWIFLLDLFILSMLFASALLFLAVKLKISILLHSIAMICYVFRFNFLLPIIDGEVLLIFILLNITFIIICFLLLIAKVYIQFKLGFSEKTEIFEKQTLERIMRVSNSIDLEILRDILKMDMEDFNEKIIHFSNKHNMKVEGNKLIINKDTLDGFLNSLDDQFREWKAMEEEKK